MVDFKHLAWTSAFAALTTVLSGCGDGSSHPPVFPVSGTVAYNGEPVAGAMVSFMGENAPKEASGITNSDGEFRLSTFSLNDGAVAGVHKVIVSKTDPEAVKAAPSMEDMMNDPAALAEQAAAELESQEDGKKPLIPLIYSSPETTPLTETVSESGENIFVIQLTD